MTTQPTEPADLTSPQPPVTSQARSARTSRETSFPQLLERLSTTAAERAAAASDPEQQRTLERVTQLARELAEALADVEVVRGRGPEIS
jgi:hypothetical protein